MTVRNLARPHLAAQSGLGGGGGGGGGARRQYQVRLVWSVMSEREVALIAQLRARCAAAGLRLSPPSRYPDDELLRMLCDVTPIYDLDEALRSCQKSLRALAARPLPPPGTDLGALLLRFEPWLKVRVRVANPNLKPNPNPNPNPHPHPTPNPRPNPHKMDGVNREGEPCVFLLINRSLQDLLLDDYLPFSAALSGCATAVQPCVLGPATRPPHACRRAHHTRVCAAHPTRHPHAGCSSGCGRRSSRPAALRRSRRCCRSSAASASRGRPSPSRRCSS